MAEIKGYHWLKNRYPTAFWQRFENVVGTGVPDVYCCFSGRSTWFELKEGALIKPRGSTKKVFKLLKPVNAEQQAWMHRLSATGGHVVIAVWCDFLKETLLFPRMKAGMLNDGCNPSTMHVYLLDPLSVISHNQDLAAETDLMARIRGRLLGDLR